MAVIATSTVATSQYLSQPLTTAAPLQSKSFRPKDSSAGTAVIPNTIAVGDIIPLVPLPIDGTYAELLIANTSLGSTVTAQLGLYAISASGPTTATGNLNIAMTPVSVNAFANAIALGTANTAFVNYRYTTKLAATVADLGWQLAGLSARPTLGNSTFPSYMLALTLTAVTSATGGTISYDINWKC